MVYPEAKEGFNLETHSKLELSTLMGEPVVKSVSAWNFDSAVYSVQVRFIPYGETDMITQYIPLEKAGEILRTYSYKVRVELPKNNYLSKDRAVELLEW